MHPLLEHPEVRAAVREVSCLADRVSECRRLRVVDERGHRYINLVLQGGGTLGIAYVGLIYALEKAGIRFAGVAGTSAGAILALAIAACRSRWDESCAENLLEMLEAAPFDEFIDGPSSVRNLIRKTLANRRGYQFGMINPQIWSHLIGNRGFNPGDVFLRWLTETLQERCGISTCEELARRSRNAPDLNLLSDASHEDAGSASRYKERITLVSQGRITDAHGLSNEMNERLHIMASGLPLGLKFVFPRDAALVKIEDGPASFARASMSVPVFFEPYRMQVSDHWKKFVEANGSPLLSAEERRSLAGVNHIAFVDGGLLSNFPIDAFETGSLVDELPGASEPTRNALDDRLMTCGISLADLRETPDDDPHDALLWDRHLSGFLGFVGQMVNGMRYIRDREARVIADADARKAMISIDTGKHFWLNFMLDEQDRRELFVSGIQAASRLIKQIEGVP